jgi:hypothetical protein
VYEIYIEIPRTQLVTSRRDERQQTSADIDEEGQLSTSLGAMEYEEITTELHIHTHTHTLFKIQQTFENHNKNEH